MRLMEVRVTPQISERGGYNQGRLISKHMLLTALSPRPFWGFLRETPVVWGWLPAAGSCPVRSGGGRVVLMTL